MGILKYRPTLSAPGAPLMVARFPSLSWVQS